MNKSVCTALLTALEVKSGVEGLDLCSVDCRSSSVDGWEDLIRGILNTENIYVQRHY